MENRRKQKRYFMFDMLSVSVEGLGQRIGHLVDLTTEGLMVCCEYPLEVGRKTRITVELREPVAGREELVVEGDCLWCRRAPSLGGFNAGFQLREPDSEALQIIAALTASTTPSAG